MKSSSFLLILSMVVLSACYNDTYQNVPEFVKGYALMVVDTGNLLRNTVTFDGRDLRKQLTNGCTIANKTEIKGYDSLYLYKFQGVQLCRNAQNLFIGVKGVKSIVSQDSVSLILLSTLGKLRLVFDPVSGAQVDYFDFSSRSEFKYKEDLCYPLDESDRPDRHPIYIECPNNHSGIVCGWQSVTLNKPKCHL